MCAAILTVVVAGTISALDNGDFAGGLRHWKASWHVTITPATEALLTDAQAHHALLFQGQSVSSGVYRLSFDFLPALSATLPEGAFKDAAFVSIYEADTLAGFIAERDRFAVAHACLDVDVDGTYNVQGSVADAPRGQGWKRFSGTFTFTRACAVVVFELYDLNTVVGDSTLRVDDVSLLPEAAP